MSKLNIRNATATLAIDDFEVINWRNLTGYNPVKTTYVVTTSNWGSVLGAACPQEVFDMTFEDFEEASAYAEDLFYDLVDLAEGGCARTDAIPEGNFSISIESGEDYEILAAERYVRDFSPDKGYELCTYKRAEGGRVYVLPDEMDENSSIWDANHISEREYEWREVSDAIDMERAWVDALSGSEWNREDINACLKLIEELEPREDAAFLIWKAGNDARLVKGLPTR